MPLWSALMGAAEMLVSVKKTHFWLQDATAVKMYVLIEQLC